MRGIKWLIALGVISAAVALLARPGGASADVLDISVRGAFTCPPTSQLIKCDIIGNSIKLRGTTSASGTVTYTPAPRSTPFLPSPSQKERVILGKLSGSFGRETGTSSPLFDNTKFDLDATITLSMSGQTKTFKGSLDGSISIDDSASTLRVVFRESTLTFDFDSPKTTLLLMLDSQQFDIHQGSETQIGATLTTLPLTAIVDFPPTFEFTTTGAGKIVSGLGNQQVFRLGSSVAMNDFAGLDPKARTCPLGEPPMYLKGGPDTIGDNDFVYAIRITNSSNTPLDSILTGLCPDSHSTSIGFCVLPSSPPPSDLKQLDSGLDYFFADPSLSTSQVSAIVFYTSSDTPQRQPASIGSSGVSSQGLVPGTEGSSSDDLTPIFGACPATIKINANMTIRSKSTLTRDYGSPLKNVKATKFAAGMPFLGHYLADIASNRVTGFSTDNLFIGGLQSAFKITLANHQIELMANRMRLLKKAMTNDWRLKANGNLTRKYTTHVTTHSKPLLRVNSSPILTADVDYPPVTIHNQPTLSNIVKGTARQQVFPLNGSATGLAIACPTGTLFFLKGAPNTIGANDYAYAIQVNNNSNVALSTILTGNARGSITSVGYCLVPGSTAPTSYRVTRFGIDYFFKNLIAVDKSSPILFFTSPDPPTLATTAIGSSGASSQGIVPGTIPPVSNFLPPLPIYGPIPGGIEIDKKIGFSLGGPFTDGPLSVLDGTSIFYQITVRNTSFTNLRNATIKDLKLKVGGDLTEDFAFPSFQRGLAPGEIVMKVFGPFKATAGSAVPGISVNGANTVSVTADYDILSILPGNTTSTGQIIPISSTDTATLNVTLPKCDTICFRAPQWWLLRTASQIPAGAILIGGLNFNNSVDIKTSITAVKAALQGGNTALQKLNEEYVAAQLNLAQAGGSSSAPVMTALGSSLSCYGGGLSNFAPVTLSNGVILRPNSMLKELFTQTDMAIRQNRTADMPKLTVLFDLLNGNDLSGKCSNGR